MQTLKFEEMNLSAETLHAISDMGFEEATPIQSQAIEVILSGRDVLGQSQTGTGKTAAFGIPCIEKINPSNRSIQALILCPTRELAIQISEEFRKLLKYKEDIRVLPVYGGQPIDRQIMALKKGAQVVVGTPGRIMDHMERRTLKLENVNMVILDEADEMLDMGFREDIEFILEKVPAERQMAMFSATMPRGILELTRKYQNDPEQIKVVHRELTVPGIDQAYFEVREQTKLEAFCRLIDLYDPQLALVFCNTKKRVDELVGQLQGRGYFAEGLHGDLKQAQRDTVMRKFRNGTLEILIATDVAARGIDVDDIDIVFNFDLPQDEEYYIHRIGRTGRAGKSGKAFTFVVGREIYKLRDIMTYTKVKIPRLKLPTLSDVEEVKAKQFLEKLKGVINEGHLTKYAHLVEVLAGEDISVIDIAAGLLKMNLYDADAVDMDLDISYSSGLDNPKYSKDKKDKSKKDGKDYKDDRDYKDSKDKKYKQDKYHDDEDMARLFISVGKRDRVRANDIVGALAGETGIPGKVIGAIDIYEEFSFVDVPKQYAKDIISGMKDKKLKGVPVSIERAIKSKGKKKGKE